MSMYYTANFNVPELLKLTWAATIYHFTTISLVSYAQLSVSHKNPPKNSNEVSSHNKQNVEKY